MKFDRRKIFANGKNAGKVFLLAGLVLGTAAFVDAQSTPITSPLTVNFTVGGSAQRSTDYALTYTNGTAISGNTIVIPANEEFVDIVVVPASDVAVEEAETVEFTIAGGGSAYIASEPQTGIVTIEDAPAAPPPSLGQEKSCYDEADGISCFLGVEPSRVRSGNAATVTWNVTGLAPNNKCRVERSPDDATFPVSSTEGAPSWQGTQSSTITSQTIFTLICTGNGPDTRTSRVINLIPVPREI